MSRIFKAFAIIACIALLSPLSVMAAGSGCVYGVVTGIHNDRAPGASTLCGQADTNIVAVIVDLDSSTRVYVYKNFSPDSVLCRTRNLQTGRLATFCGKLKGFLLNPGTVNEVSGWNFYPSTLTVN